MFRKTRIVSRVCVKMLQISSLFVLSSNNCRILIACVRINVKFSLVHFDSLSRYFLAYIEKTACSSLAQNGKRLLSEDVVSSLNVTSQFLEVPNLLGFFPFLRSQDTQCIPVPCTPHRPIVEHGGHSPTVC